MKKMQSYKIIRKFKEKAATDQRRLSAKRRVRNPSFIVDMAAKVE